MSADYILHGSALWFYEWEISNAGLLAYTGQLGVPFHKHKGNIYLTDNAIVIAGDDAFEIELSAIGELYLGCDDVYKPEYLKNFGYFIKPPRIKFASNRSGLNKIYLIISNGIINTNAKWYKTLVSLLS